MGETIVVFPGGDPPPASVLDGLPDAAYVIAADSGFDHAHRLGVKIDLLVGDLDSISPPGSGSPERSSSIPPTRTPPTWRSLSTQRPGEIRRR